MHVSRDRRFRKRNKAQLEIHQLQTEIIELILLELDPLAMQRVAATCRDIREIRHSQGFEFAMQLKYRCDEAWVPVAVSGGVSLFITESGLMYCGSDRPPHHAIPTNVPGNGGIRFRCVSSSWGFHAAVSTVGTLYTWGMDRLGYELPIDPTPYDGYMPTMKRRPMQVQALVGHRVRSVSAATQHVLVVTEDGVVFSWGRNRFGQCGADDVLFPHLVFPRQVEAFMDKRARSASAGERHSLVVTDTGELYSFGDTSHGRLGRTQTDTRMAHVAQVAPVIFDTHIVAAVAGDIHSLALTDKGQVYIWGERIWHYVGVDGTDVPVLVPALNDVCYVAVGLGTSCAVTKQGKLFTWGFGRDGQLGHGDTDDQEEPKLVNPISEFRSEHVIRVSMHDNKTVAVTHGGNVYGWGKTYGLGLFNPGSDRLLSPRLYVDMSCKPQTGVDVHSIQR